MYQPRSTSPDTCTSRGPPHLTHVPAAVHLLHVSDVELPLLVFPVGEGDPLVAGDDAVVDGKDGLGVHPDPGDLV